MLKVLFTYYEKEHSEIIADFIQLQAIKQSTREIICYDDGINTGFERAGIFLYKRKKLKESIISKVFDQNDFEGIRVQFGDGDCCFA